MLIATSYYCENDFNYNDAIIYDYYTIKHCKDIFLAVQSYPSRGQQYYIGDVAYVNKRIEGRVIAALKRAGIPFHYSHNGRVTHSIITLLGGPKSLQKGHDVLKDYTIEWNYPSEIRAYIDKR